jgi:ElaB/YqjD/DUF883 family membrane-anchored ribosome-binding protein
MKKLLLGLMIIGIGSQLLTSCGGSDNMLSQFSKRKYLKKHKFQKIKIEENSENYAYDLESNYLEELVAVEEVAAEETVSQESNGGYFPEMYTSSNSEHELESIEDENEDLNNKLSNLINSQKEKIKKLKEEREIEKKEEEEDPVDLRTIHPWAIATVFAILLGVLTVGLLMPLAMLTGFAAKAGINRSPKKYKGLGIASIGIFLGYLSIILFLFLFILIIILIGSTVDT